MNVVEREMQSLQERVWVSINRETLADRTQGFTVQGFTRSTRASERFTRLTILGRRHSVPLNMSIAAEYECVQAPRFARLSAAGRRPPPRLRRGKSMQE